MTVIYSLHCKYKTQKRYEETCISAPPVRPQHVQAVLCFAPSVLSICNCIRDQRTELTFISNFRT